MFEHATRAALTNNKKRGKSGKKSEQDEEMKGRLSLARVSVAHEQSLL